MQALIDTFAERKSQLLTAFGVHIQLSLTALLFSVFIGIGLGLLVFPHLKMRLAVIQFSSVMQTIPSLALLGLLIPILGIGEGPALVALTIYGLFPIVQATITGLREIDPTLEEAGDALGMNRWEKLRHYQAALAMPVIMDGVRTAGVLIIGTATLAALIGAGGLGEFILLGIDRRDSSLVIIGALSVAILAITINAALLLMQRLQLRKVIILFVALSIGVLASFVPSHSGKADLTIAGKIEGVGKIVCGTS